MERISSVPNTSKSNNNSKRNPNYSSNARKANGMPIRDALAYKEELERAQQAISAAKDEDKFKSLIEKAEEKLTSKIVTAPLKEDERYKRETTMMMANGGIYTKSRMERKPIEELSTKQKKTITSYSTSYQQYTRDLGYDTNIKYKNYEDMSKDARSYKNNHSKYLKNKESEKTNYIEEPKSEYLIEQPEKISFWNKLKDKIKKIFAKEEPKQENVRLASTQTKEDKAAQYRRQNISKVVPQIDKNEVERRKKQSIRELAIKER